MKRNVLVFPCGSEIGLELHRSLSHSTHLNLIGGSSVRDHGEYVYSNYIDGIPLVSEDAFQSKLNQIIEEHQIDYIFPAHDDVVLVLADAVANGKISAEVITSPVETCKIARSKRLTYDALHDKIDTPKIFKDVDNVPENEYPVFLKPDSGQGSKGIAIARDQEELIFYKNRNSNLLILEYLPGHEYTVDCFTDKSGKLRFSEGRIRNRISNGISVSSYVEDKPEFKLIAEKINAALKFRGVWFFQVKESAEKKLILMEIAPRVAGTMGLSRSRGVNLPLLSIFDREGGIEVIENSYTSTIDRALENRYRLSINFRHVYLDFDDLIVFDGKVNAAIIAFIYQCLNNGINIHLITKHSEDINESLRKYRLEGVFDEVIHMQGDEHKFEYIKERDAIFIDDSFAERKEVHDKLGLPVFDAQMIECLVG